MEFFCLADLPSSSDLGKVCCKPSLSQCWLRREEALRKATAKGQDKETMRQTKQNKGNQRQHNARKKNDSSEAEEDVTEQEGEGDGNKGEEGESGEGGGHEEG